MRQPTKHSRRLLQRNLRDGRGWLLQRNDLLFVFLQRRQNDSRTFRIVARPRLAIVSQSDLRPPLRVACLLRAFRPRIAVAVQGHAFDAESLATLLELGCAVAAANGAQIRKQVAIYWERT